MTDAPVRAFLDRVEGLLSPSPDMPAIGHALADLATDTDYCDRLVPQLEEDQLGVLGLHMPERGPRVFLMHRPRGVMSYVHSHGTWACVAPVRGVETHKRYEVAELQPPDHATLIVAEELRLQPGEAATIAPPNDIHSHGHAGGDDALAWTLIVTGDDQLQFPRREYDLEAGRYRDLPPGEFGQLNLPPKS